jgi:hypothetical protein
MAHKFDGHLDFECSCCCGSCTNRNNHKACSQIRMRKPPLGSSDPDGSGRVGSNSRSNIWTQQVDTFPAFFFNATHVKMNFNPSFLVPVSRLFPLRHARLGADLMLPVPKDHLWFLSHKPKWGAPPKSSGVAYGQGCRQTAYPPMLYEQLFGLPPSSSPRAWIAYADVRAVDKGLFHCAKWLHTHGYASFYGCYDEDIGFDEPEESGLLWHHDWQSLVLGPHAPRSATHWLDRGMG